jgi:hypothetical protein
MSIMGENLSIFLGERAREKEGEANACSKYKGEAVACSQTHPSLQKKMHHTHHKKIIQLQL